MVEALNKRHFLGGFENPPDLSQRALQLFMCLRMSETDTDAERTTIDLLKGTWRGEGNSGLRCLRDQRDQRASGGNREPTMKAGRFGNDRQPVAKYFVGNGIAPRSFRAFELHLTHQVTAVDEARDDFCHQR